MAQQKCSIVIPVIPKHFHYLKKLLDELVWEDNFIGEIHVCASSVSQTSLSKLRRIIAKSSFSEKTKIHSCLEIKTAGENRNYGWDRANFEIVVFLDADDVYHPNRLEIVTDVMFINQGDAVVHDYYRMTPKSIFKFGNANSYSSITGKQLYKLNRASLENPLPDGDLYAGESNLLLPEGALKSLKVHHGHLTVRRDIPIRYTNRKLGEDGELVREILKHGYNLVYVSAKLSIYDRINCTNFFLSLKGHALVRLSRMYRLIFFEGK
jgi:glycosyltransferase involved in cell wall biosynthesis